MNFGKVITNDRFSEIDKVLKYSHFVIKFYKKIQKYNTMLRTAIPPLPPASGIINFNYPKRRSMIDETRDHKTVILVGSGLQNSLYYPLFG